MGMKGGYWCIMLMGGYITPWASWLCLLEPESGRSKGRSMTQGAKYKVHTRVQGE